MSVQSFCKSTQPLGKMVDYIQEDMDGMTQELKFWRKEAAKYEKQLRERNTALDSNNDDKFKKLDKTIDEQVISQKSINSRWRKYDL